MRLVSPSGGGFGPPCEREPALVCQDVLEGLLSTEGARVHYGVVMDEMGAADVVATERLREEMRNDMA